MKINNIALVAANVDPVILSFRDPNNENPYRVKTVTGLDADDIVKKYYGKGSGGNFYDLKLNKREIVAHIGLNPRWAIDEDYSNLRDSLYRIASSSRSGEVSVNFRDGETVIATIIGTISKMEASHFEKLPDVTLTITCPDPMLRAPAQITVPIGGLDPSDTIITDSHSTSPHGLHIAIRFNDSTTSGLFIQGEGFYFIIYKNLLANDIIHINNDLGPKFIWLKRGATTIQIADNLANGAIWPILFPGPNHFSMNVEAEWNSIKYTPTYWGV